MLITWAVRHEKFTPPKNHQEGSLHLHVSPPSNLHVAVTLELLKTPLRRWETPAQPLNLRLRYDSVLSKSP